MAANRFWLKSDGVCPPHGPIRAPVCFCSLVVSKDGLLVGVANQRREHGPIDFIGEAGAQVGIGDSKDEKQARAAAASAERAAEVAERIGDGKAAAKAERMEKFDETKKAWGLEKHVKDLDGEP